jgi:hypothetical protein
LNDTILLIGIYIIRFIFSILRYYFDEKYNSYKEENLGLPFFVGAWIISFITVPLTIFIMLCVAVGLSIKYLAHLLDKLTKTKSNI